MASINVSLPERMQRFVEQQVETGGYQSPDQYVRALVRQAQVSAERKLLDAMLQEGLEGTLSEMTDDDWASLRQEIIDRSPELRDVEDP
jgi:antitoxin ParD1/3/4